MLLRETVVRMCAYKYVFCVNVLFILNAGLIT